MMEFEATSDEKTGVLWFKKRLQKCSLIVRKTTPMHR